MKRTLHAAVSCLLMALLVFVGLPCVARADEAPVSVGEEIALNDDSGLEVVDNEGATGGAAAADKTVDGEETEPTDEAAAANEDVLAQATDEELAGEDDIVAVTDEEGLSGDETAPPLATGEEGSEEQTVVPSIKYCAHVQREGWQSWVADGTMAGTEGRSLRAEGFRFELDGAEGDVLCETHVQTIGWLPAVSAGSLAGTEGEGRRAEAIKLTLAGPVAETYDVWYRAHVQGIGWQSWVTNGAKAGTTGQSRRLEAIEVLLVPKGNTIPSVDSANYRDNATCPMMGVHYQAHVQNKGWQDEVADKVTAGTTGQALRMEAVRIKTSGLDGGIRYRAYVQDIGWQPWVQDGAVAGTTGERRRMEAIEIELTGDASQQNRVYYRTHVQGIGWTAWTSDGETSGITGRARRIEALQLVVLPADADAPSDDEREKVITKEYLNGVDLSGWNEGINIAGVEGDFFIIMATEGVQGTIYNPWYREWANKALDSGRFVGFYHYANGGNPLAEADSFVQAIQSFKGRAIACLRWEDIGNNKFDTGADVEWCKKFLDRVKLRFGGTPFLYLSKNYSNIYNWSSIAKDYPLWGAEYPDYKDVNGYQDDPWQSSNGWGAWGRRPTIFQYTSTGILQRNGGVEYFDFNLFYGTANDWLRYQM